jgi:hypothetical protein
VTEGHLDIPDTPSFLDEFRTIFVLMIYYGTDFYLQVNTLWNGFQQQFD